MLYADFMVHFLNLDDANPFSLCLSRSSTIESHFNTLDHVESVDSSSLLRAITCIYPLSATAMDRIERWLRHGLAHAQT